MTLTSIIVQKIRSSYDRRNRNLAVNTTYTALSKMFQTWNDKLIVYWNLFILHCFCSFSYRIPKVIQMMFTSVRCSTLNNILQYFDIFLTLSSFWSQMFIFMGLIQVAHPAQRPGRPASLDLLLLLPVHYDVVKVRMGFAT